MPLPPEVVLGYRSSSPIIRAEADGPESRRVEMGRHGDACAGGGGRRCIFEGTAGFCRRR